MIEKKYRWIVWGVILGAFLSAVGRVALPRIVNYYSEPKRCTKDLNVNPVVEYCLTEKLQLPLHCIFEEEKANTRECRFLRVLAEKNKKSVTFRVLGHDVTVKRVFAESGKN